MASSAYTPAELERYASYHWLQLEDNAHIWRTIANECVYLGTTNTIAKGQSPAEQLPLLNITP